MAYQSVTFTWGCNTMIDDLVSRHAVYGNWKIDVQMTFQRYNFKIILPPINKKCLISKYGICS